MSTKKRELSERTPNPKSSKSAKREAQKAWSIDVAYVIEVNDDLWCEVSTPKGAQMAVSHDVAPERVMRLVKTFLRGRSIHGEMLGPYVACDRASSDKFGELDAYKLVGIVYTARHGDAVVKLTLRHRWRGCEPWKIERDSDGVRVAVLPCRLTEQKGFRINFTDGIGWTTETNTSECVFSVVCEDPTTPEHVTGAIRLLSNAARTHNKTFFQFDMRCIVDGKESSLPTSAVECLNACFNKIEYN